MERLSTGVRVNSAKDDAAGLAIGQNMTSQIRGLNQAVRNINDGINLVQTAEGGLNSVSNMLQRMRELAVQAANGTYSDVQRAYLNKECQALQESISQVVDTTMWNDQKLLDGSFSKPIQIGSDVDTKMDIAIPTLGLKGASIVLGQPIIDLGTNGKLIKPVQVDGGKWYYFWDRSGDGTSANTGLLNNGSDLVDHYALNGIFNQDVHGIVGGSGKTTDVYRFATLNGVRVALPTVGAVTAPPLGPNGANSCQPGTAIGSSTPAQGSNSLNPNYDDLLAIWDAYNGISTGTNLEGTPPGWSSASDYPSATESWGQHAVVRMSDTYGAAGATFENTNDAFSYSVALQVLPESGSDASIDISTIAGATSALSTLDNGIDSINKIRATLGSYINRLAYAADNVTNISSNATQSRSTIIDADYALETTNLAKNQIIQQAATAMLAQANQQPQAVMALLKNS